MDTTTKTYRVILSKTRAEYFQFVADQYPMSACVEVDDETLCILKLAHTLHLRDDTPPYNDMTTYVIMDPYH